MIILFYHSNIMSSTRKRVLTGTKPTSDQLHIGNFFGAIKPLLDYQQDPNRDVFFFIANMHTLSQLKDSTKIKDNIKTFTKLYYACWVNLEKTTLFVQSDIVGHAELWRILTCMSTMWQLERMHSYKDAINKGIAWEISAGTFIYPTLMAADILLYDADIVPVGKDQKQHVEFARDIAKKFNNTFWEILTIPDVFIKKEVETIPWIDGRKMSKSYNNYLGLLDDQQTIIKKIKAITTNALTVDQPKNPDQCNVYNIIRLFLSPEEDINLRKKYESWWLSYKEVKDYLYQKCRPFIEHIQYNFYNTDDQLIEQIIKQGNEKARTIAQQKKQQIYKAIWR